MENISVVPFNKQTISYKSSCNITEKTKADRGAQVLPLSAHSSNLSMSLKLTHSMAINEKNIRHEGEIAGDIRIDTIEESVSTTQIKKNEGGIPECE